MCVSVCVCVYVCVCVAATGGGYSTDICQQTGPPWSHVSKRDTRGSVSKLYLQLTLASEVLWLILASFMFNVVYQGLLHGKCYF